MIKCFMHRLVTPTPRLHIFPISALSIDPCVIAPDGFKTSCNGASLNLLLMTFMYIIIVWHLPNSRIQLLHLEGSLHFISPALAKIDWSKTHIIPLNFNESFIFNALFIITMMVQFSVVGES